MMINLDSVLSKLPGPHRNALLWFYSHTGKETGWPGKLSDGTLLASKAKGIYKPQWTEYALSIRQNINSPYPDMPPIKNADGTWLYCYFQEDLDPNSRDEVYTNTGLIKCMNDSIPVGVFRQIKQKPNPIYIIEGLAFVSSWADGFFTFEGISPTGTRYTSIASDQTLNYGTVKDIDSFIIQNEAGKILDARKKIAALITKRQGQGQFRKDVLEAYGNICAITGYDALSALEAAHIIPYRGQYTNHVENGLLLRADLHSLFDQGLIGVNPNDHKVLLSKRLIKTKYEGLENKEIRIPQKTEFQPSERALTYHVKWAGLMD